MEDLIERNDMSFAREAAEIDEAVFRLLAAFYNINPNTDLIKASMMLMPEQFGEAEIIESITLIKNDAVKAFEDEELLLNLKRDWTKLFRGVSPDYGPKPPYEQLYHGSKGLELISELAGIYFEHDYYEFFELNNRHDYIGTELAFVAYIATMRKDAAAAGDFGKYNSLSKVSEDFIKIHLSSWAKEFQLKANDHVSTDFYRGVIKLTTLITKDKGVNDEHTF